MVFLLTFLISCNNQKEVQTILIDVEAAIPKLVEDVFSNISYINIKLPEDIYFGEIWHIKSFDKYLFIHDFQQTHSITIIDTLGNYINQLKRKGNGPSEYMDLESFAFDKENKEIVINDRVLK